METIEFKDRIKQYLEETGKTQEEMAAKIGMSKQAISAWVTGRTTPSLGDVRKIAEKLGVSLPWLLGHPNTSMTGRDAEVEKLFEDKVDDSVTMDEAPIRNVNGSMFPVYSEAQLDKRMEMISRALDMYDRKKIDEDTLRLIVNSLR